MNQVWNWVKGEGSSWERERVPLVYWSAWPEGRSPAGATLQGKKGDSVGEDGLKGEGGMITYR